MKIYDSKDLVNKYVCVSLKSEETITATLLAMEENGILLTDLEEGKEGMEDVAYYIPKQEISYIHYSPSGNY